MLRGLRREEGRSEITTKVNKIEQTERLGKPVFSDDDGDDDDDRKKLKRLGQPRVGVDGVSCGQTCHYVVGFMATVTAGDDR